jgi:hypothetical protein
MTYRYSHVLATLAAPLLIAAPWVYADAFMPVYLAGTLAATFAVISHACGD